MIIRFLTLFFLSLFLLSPVIKYLKIYFDNPIVIFVQDNSESIQLEQGRNVKSADDYRALMDNFQKRIEENFELKTYSFGQDLIETRNFGFTDKVTDFTPVINEINSKFTNYNVGALIIASDGIYNKGQNPVYSSRDFNFPVYTIALGDTARKKDLILVTAFANKIAFLGDYFPIEITINCFGFQNKDVDIVISRDNNEILKQSVSIDRNDFSKQMKFEIPAENKGLQSYYIRILPQKGEFDLLNNSKEIILDVIDDKKKVLILANSVHPDISAIRNALQSTRNFITESFTLDEFKGKISEYQLVIFHQLPSLQFNIQKLINELNENLVPAMVIMGTQTDIQSFNSLKTGILVNGNNRLYEQSIPIINTSFKIFEVDENLRDFVSQCPPLAVPFGNFEIEGQTEVLFNQQIKGIKTQKPLFCFTDVKQGIKGKFGLLMGEGLWRWRMRDFQISQNHVQFDGLINKVVHYLALDVQKDRFSVFHNRIFNESDEINFRAEFYNQSYELINTPDVKFTVFNADNKEFKYQFSRVEKSYSLNIGNLPVGNYRFIAKIESEGKVFEKKGEFRIAELNVEHQDLTANHSMLQQLSAQSNGKMYYTDQLDSLIDDLQESDNVKPVSHTVTDLADLIEIKWIFFLMIVLLATEWFLRKFYGSY